MAKALSIQVREAFACPKCGAPPNEYCKTPSGLRCRGVGGVHGERLALATPEMHQAATCKAQTFEEIMADLKSKYGDRPITIVPFFD